MVTIDDVKETVEKYYSDCHDEVIENKDMNVSVNTEGGLILNHKDQEYQFTDIGKQQLLHKMGMPVSYFDKLPATRTVEDIKYWQEVYDDSRFFRFKGNTVRAVLSDRYLPIDNRPVINGIFNAIDKDKYEVKSFRMDDTAMLLRITESNKVIERGEILGGYSIHNSEIGMAAFRIEAMIYRVLCSNGMMLPISGARHRFIHLGNDDKRINIEGSMRSAISAPLEVERVLEPAKAYNLLPSPVPNEDERGGLVKAVGKYVTQETAERAVEYVEKEFPQQYNRWTIANGISWISQRSRAYRQIQLDGVAGQVLSGRILTREEVMQNISNN